MKNAPKNYEARGLAGPVEVRQNGEGNAVIVGLGAVFNSLSENLGGFREMIDPGAFDDADMSDVRGLFNHDENYVLGRTSSNTMKLRVTDAGLRYEIDAPDTATIRDLVVSPLSRGDVDRSSFGFTVADDDWEENEDGVIIRTIKKFRRIFDVGPVTFPAYPDASAGVRSMKQFIESRTAHAEAIAHRETCGKQAERNERRAVKHFIDR